jgi:Ca-activated chloride channel family protein
MTFLSPERLWLLAAVVALAALYVGLQFRRRQYAVRFTNTALLDSVAPKRPGWRRHVPAVLFLASIATLVVGLAQPARDQKVPRERATVILAIDTSLSMGADDVTPTRFEAAKDSARRFLDLLPEKLNLGLVSFDGTAVMRVSPTTDREIVKDAIDNLELDQATAIGDAILASLAAIETVPPDEEGSAPPARIVLMSDGETTAGVPNSEGIEAALEAEVPVSTIAFGTDEGTIQLEGDPFPTPVIVDEDALEEIAETTGGTFFRAVSADQLNDVYTDIGTSVGFVTEEREITMWFVAGALVLLLGTAGLSMLWFSRLP